MPVLGRCSRCHNTHYGPFGSRCKNQLEILDELPEYKEAEVQVKMACAPGSGFTDRDDPQYMAMLEEHFIKTTAQETDKQEQKDDVYRNIMHRLDKLEEKSNTNQGGRAGGPGSPQGQPTAADFNSLTDTLQNLSMAMTADTTPKTGIEYRPEYYVQVLAKGFSVKNMNHLVMKSEELLYGMLKVYMFLLEHSSDSRGYLGHMDFVARHIMEKNFTPVACLKYDRHVVDEVLAGRTRFKDFNPVAAGIFLHAGAVPAREQCVGFDRPIRSSFNPRQTVDNTTNRMRDCNKENIPLYMPEQWPSELCFNFNAKQCVGRCTKLHVCSFCRLRHRLADCKFALKDSQDKGFQSYSQSVYNQYQ